MSDLPQLPRPDRNAWPHGWHDLFNADQMRQYATEAIAADRAKREPVTDVLLAERDHWHEHYRKAVMLLTSIHSLLYPPPVSVPDGRTTVFRPKGIDPHEVLQQLSDRIRALPDEIAVLPVQQAHTHTPDCYAHGCALMTLQGQSLGPVQQAKHPDDPTDRFICDVAAELKRARAKFPGDRIMTIALAEEFGELAKAMLDESGANVWKEAVQTAVMAARVAIDGDSSVDEWRAAKGLGNHRCGVLMPLSQSDPSLDYDGSWGHASKGWPEIAFATADECSHAHYVCWKFAKVPYGSYVLVEKALRLQQQAYVDVVQKALLSYPYRKGWNRALAAAPTPPGEVK